MRSKTIKELILLGFFLALVMRTGSNFSILNENEQLNNFSKKLESAGSWVVTQSIRISENPSKGDYTWPELVAAFPWCSGSGSWSDPYVIENVTFRNILFGPNPYCIYIVESDDPFIIRNCRFENSVWGIRGGASGINNWVYNGLIHDCTFSGLWACGIFLEWSDNITIKNNVAKNMILGGGIFVYSDSKGNNISNNTSEGNEMFGIDVWGPKNIVQNNTIRNNRGNGIYLENCCNSTVRDNEVYDNTKNGIIVQTGFLGFIENNNTIYRNEIYNNGWSGIAINNSLLINCSDNKVYNNDVGIHINRSNNNTIWKNEVYNNDVEGIYVNGSKDNNIFENEVYNNDIAILLENDTNNTISENKVYSNEMGIYLDNSECDNIFNNNVYENTIEGIGIEDSVNNIIYNNTIESHDYGIDVQNSDHNKLIENTVSNNLLVGISLSNSHNNTINGNTINITENYGLEIKESNNNTIGANILNNNLRGLKLEECFDNTLRGNLMKGSSIDLEGSLEGTSSHIIDTTNKINGKSVYYYANEINLGFVNFTKAGNPGQLILVNCNDSLISNLNISGATVAIQAHYCINNTYSKNNVSFNIEGIGITFSSNNTIIKNNVTHNYTGIILRYSDNNDIIRNVINDSLYCGILLYQSNYNNVSHNRLYRNLYCIRDEYCTGNFYLDNTCKVTYIRDNIGGGGGGGGGGGNGDGEAIPGYNLMVIIAMIGVISIILARRLRKQNRF